MGHFLAYSYFCVQLPARRDRGGGQEKPPFDQCAGGVHIWTDIDRVGGPRMAFLAAKCPNLAKLAKWLDDLVDDVLAASLLAPNHPPAQYECIRKRRGSQIKHLQRMR